MTILSRSELSSALSKMEQGRFQDFCLAFLPLHNSSYSGLARFGHTVEGKTRKGTPDLIKTTPEGFQIAVQCSTEENYWIPPRLKEKYSESWKPCQDIDKCLKALDNPIEIILCCNSEIPTNHPNAKTRIIEFAQAKTDTKILPMSLEDLDEALTTNIDNSDYEPLFREFFPHVFQLIELRREAQQNRVALEILRESQPAQINLLMNVLTEVLNKTADIEKAKNLTLNKIEEHEARYQEREIPLAVGVMRDAVSQEPLNDLVGKVTLLTGVPKIGKTFLLRQIGARWIDHGGEVKRYNAGLSTQDEENDFLAHFIRSILLEFLLPEVAKNVAFRKQSLEEMDFRYGSDNPRKKTAFFLDNANDLSSNALKRLSRTLLILKKKTSLANIAVVLTSNRDIRLNIPAIDDCLVAPAWNQRELKELLQVNGVIYDPEYPHKYIEVLEIKSGGHPALALALARKYPTCSDLALNMISKQGLEDADLNQEVKSILYQDLLIDADHQNFVQRLSVLIYPAVPAVIETICYNVKPLISRSPTVMLDRLGQAIIEGEAQTGFYISHVFKEVAKQHITQSQQQDVYKQVSATLLQIKDNIIDVKHFTEGILYALLGLELNKAFFWSTFLLHNVLKQTSEPERLRHVLERIYLVTLVKPPLDAPSLFAYGAVLFASAVGYSRINEHTKAGDILSRFDLSKTTNSGDRLENKFKLLQHGISWFTVIAFCSAREYQKAAEKLGTIDIDESEKFFHEKYRTSVDGLKIGAELLTLVPIDQIPKALVTNLVSRATVSDAQLSSLLSAGFGVGLKAAKEGKPVESILSLFTHEYILSELIQKMALAAYYLETKDPRKAISVLSDAQARLSEATLDGPLAVGKILQSRADAFYIQGELREASKAYEQQLKRISDETCFDYGWAQYRIGLAEEDAALAEQRFSKASKVFAALELFDTLASCQAERAVALAQLGRKGEFATIVEWLFSEYYENGREDFGSCCAMASAQLERLLAELEGRPLLTIGGLSFPELKRRTYQFGTNQVRPTAGIVTVFYQLAKFYGFVGLNDKKVEVLRRALSKPSDNEVDSEIIPLVAKEYLDEIVGDHLAFDIIQVMKIILDCQTRTTTVSASLGFLSWCVFSKFDVLSTQQPQERSEVFSQVLNELEKSGLSTSSHASFWLAAINLRKTMLQPGSRTRDEEARLWKICYEHALTGQNHDVMMRSSHALSFDFVEFAYSLKELGDINLNFVKAVEAQGIPTEYLASFGRNLFNFWSEVGFKHLSEWDLEVKRALLDGAKSLNKAGFSADKAAPFMVLLLASAYDHAGPATEWALEQAKRSIDQVPSDVARYLREKLQSKGN